MKFAGLLFFFSVLVFSDVFADGDADQAMRIAKQQFSTFLFAIEHEKPELLHEIYLINPDTEEKVAAVFADYKQYELNIESAAVSGEDISVSVNLRQKGAAEESKRSFVLKKDAAAVDGWRINE